MSSWEKVTINWEWERSEEVEREEKTNDRKTEKERNMD